jgi:hypothetical protein
MIAKLLLGFVGCDPMGTKLAGGARDDACEIGHHRGLVAAREITCGTGSRN